MKAQCMAMPLPMPCHLLQAANLRCCTMARQAVPHAAMIGALLLHHMS